MFRRLHKWKPSPREYRVVILEGTTLSYELQGNAKGEDLLQMALKDLGIPENEYFGLFDPAEQKWIVLEKTARKQLRGNGPYTLHLCVEAYPKDHSSLASSIIRHFLYLQVRKDLMEGRLLCSSDAKQHLTALVCEDSRCANQSACDAILRESTPQSDQVIGLDRMSSVTKESHDYEREFLDCAQLEEGFGCFVCTALDSSHLAVTLCVGPNGIQVGDRTIIEWGSVTKVSTFGRNLTMCFTTIGMQSFTHTFAFQSSMMCCSVAHHCARLQTVYSDLVCERTKTKLKRLLSMRFCKDIARPDATSSSRQDAAPTSRPHATPSSRPHATPSSRLKKTPSFSARFRSFRNRRAISLGRSLENILQQPSMPAVLLPSKIHHPSTSTLPAGICPSLSVSPSLCLSPPPASSAPSFPSSQYSIDHNRSKQMASDGQYHVDISFPDCSDHQPSSIPSSTGPLSDHQPSSIPSSTGPLSAQPNEQPCLESEDGGMRQVASEVGDLDGVLRMLEEKLQENHSATRSLYQQKVCTNRRNQSHHHHRSVSATDVHSLKPKDMYHMKSYSNSPELWHFSTSMIADPCVQGLVFEGCQSQSGGTEL